MKARDLNIRECDRGEVSEFIETHHYSKSINGVKSSACFAVEYKGSLVGAVLYGQMSTTAWKRFGEGEQEVLELRRLVMLDECPKNSESRIVGWTIRWVRRNCPNVKVIVSYADPNHGHTGIIYKAANFNLHGMSGKDKGFRDVESGKIYHSRALRTKYKGDFKPFVKRLRQRLEDGLLKPIELKPKYCYTYRLQNATDSGSSLRDSVDPVVEWGAE
jgi:hypothetical protein